MNCKFCGEELPEKGNFCPVCGKENAREAVLFEEIVPEEIPAEEASSVEVVPPESAIPQEPVEEILAPEVNKMKRTAAITGCVAALAVLALVLFFGIRGTFAPDGEGWNVGAMFDWEIFRENDIFKQDSYTVSDAKAQKKADVVVATLGDAELTNAQLQIYYQMEVMEFLNQYGYYLSYFGLDYTQPLDQQPCMLLEGYTWQQFFLESALNTWQENQAMAMEAAANGFRLDSHYQESLDKLAESMEASAIQNGYASADALLQDQCGANTSMEQYQSYMDVMYNGIFYMSDLAAKIEVPSDEALADYFNKNKETLESQGVKQDGSYVVDVRHILVLPEGATVETIRTETFSEEAWEAGRVKAQAILDAWKAGETTEERFAALANEHSADPGSNTNGGLYTQIAVGDMVKEFEEWCFDSQRKAGDVDLVKTDLGYHIMYFSGRGEELWLTKTRQAYLLDVEQQLHEAIFAKYEMEVSYGKIALAQVDMA